MIMGGRPAVRLNKATGSGRWKGLGAWGPVCVLSVLIRACPMTARAYRACSAQTTLRPGVPCREHERRTGGGEFQPFPAVSGACGEVRACLTGSSEIL